MNHNEPMTVELNVWNLGMCHGYVETMYETIKNCDKTLDLLRLVLVAIFMVFMVFRNPWNTRADENISPTPWAPGEALSRPKLAIPCLVVLQASYL